MIHKTPKRNISLWAVSLIFIFALAPSACQSGENLNLNYVLNNYGKFLSVFNAELTEFNESISSQNANLNKSTCLDSTLTESLHGSYKTNRTYENKVKSIVFASSVYKVLYNSLPATRIDDIDSLKLKTSVDSIAVYLLVNTSMSDFNEFSGNAIPDGGKLVRDTVPFAIFCRHEGKLKIHSISKELAKIAIEMTRYEINQ